MSQIFRIKNDDFNYQAFALDIDDFIDFVPDEIPENQIIKFSYYNLQLKPWWGEVHSAFKGVGGEERQPLPDVSTWIDATLVLSSRAQSILKLLLSTFGEFLPVQCDHEIFYIFNCLTFGMADEINSKQDIQEGAFMGLKSLQFNTVDVDQKIVFKTTLNRCSDIYCNQEFKNMVESNNLSGIAFDADLEGIF